MNEFDYVESLEFSARINVCSGFKCVVNSFRDDEIIQKLIAGMSDWRNQLSVFERVQLVLLKDSGGDEYEHQHDTAMAAYLYVLGQCNMALATLCCNLVLDIDRIFWARKMAWELKYGLA
jgi:hypothetical protein